MPTIRVKILENSGAIWGWGAFAFPTTVDKENFFKVLGDDLNILKTFTKKDGIRIDHWKAWDILKEDGYVLSGSIDGYSIWKKESTYAENTRTA